MMNKIFFCIGFMVLLSGCSQKTIYIKPAITGVLLDSNTQSPIRNTGILDTYLTNKDNKFTKTDNKGYFRVEQKTINYFFIAPDYRMLQSSPTNLYINVPNYNNKIINYNNPKYKSSSQSRSFSQPYQVDVGKIYLTPVKVGEEPIVEKE